MVVVVHPINFPLPLELVNMHVNWVVVSSVFFCGFIYSSVYKKVSRPHSATYYLQLSLFGKFEFFWSLVCPYFVWTLLHVLIVLKTLIHPPIVSAFCVANTGSIEIGNACKILIIKFCCLSRMLKLTRRQVANWLLIIEVVTNFSSRSGFFYSCGSSNVFLNS